MQFQKYPLQIVREAARTQEVCMCWSPFCVGFEVQKMTQNGKSDLSVKVTKISK